MRIIKVLCPKDIYWKISRHSPSYYELKSLPGWSVINPLIYREITSLTNDILVETKPIWMIGHNFALVSTKGLMFAAPPDFVSNKLNFAQFIDYLNLFLEHLRYVSKQVDIPRQVAAISFITEIAELPKISLPTSIHKIPKYTRAYISETALTWEKIEIADTTLIDDKLPIYGTLLLDAMLAYLESDYRRAILYAAMSAETVATTKLDEAYNKVLREGDHEGIVRIISLPQRKGAIVVKDPIYEYLSSRTDFTQLLHERPLYLFKRSMLVENEQLYQNAEKLYRTRNKIVHQGDLSSNKDTSYFGINRSGAKNAIACAIEIFKWFGVSEKYTLPEQNLHVRVDSLDTVEVIEAFFYQ